MHIIIEQTQNKECTLNRVKKKLERMLTSSAYYRFRTGITPDSEARDYINRQCDPIHKTRVITIGKTIGKYGF